ncbi:MAG: DUF4434 domain-containing protein [Candidatus Alcyoniella australis]|nr:DUF4434 domain-containing protein [Candidatus Alcyoniella australis]
MSARAILRWLLLALLCLIVAGLAACDADDDDDDGGDHADDDDETIVLQLDGVFLDPLWNTGLEADELSAKLGRAKQELQAKIVILPWTLLHDEALYASSRFERMDGLAVDDLVTALLDAAQENQMQVVIGLSAARNAAEINLDPEAAEVARQTALVQELSALYADHPALLGFYLNYELTAEPGPQWLSLLTKVADACHDAAPDQQLWISACYPGPPLTLMVDEILRRDSDVQIEEIDDSQFRAFWARSWIEAAMACGVDVLLIADRIGAHRNNWITLERDYASLLEARTMLGAQVELAAQVELFDTVDQGTLRPWPGPADPERVEQQIELAQRYTGRAVGYSWDLFDEQAQQPDTALAADVELEDSALWIDEHLHAKCWRDGQIVTVRDGQWPVDAGSNWWQEDACWLTGIYCSAQSFRYAVTGDPEAAEYARRAWQTLHNMSHTTPLPGEVVRNYTTYFFEQLVPLQPNSDTIKRWHRHPVKELYWVGDISIDQLAGYLPGIANYYDLVADEQERATIRQDVHEIMTLIVDNGLRAVQFDGQNATFGNLRASPSLALCFLQIAWHITGEQRFRDKFLDIYYGERMDQATLLVYYAMHNIARKYGGQHFLDSGFYHLLAYEEDPQIYGELARVLDYIYAGSHDFGNAAANLTHRAHNPDSNGGLIALNELQRTDVPMLDNGYWYATVNQDYSAGDVYIPIERRPAKEYYWSYAPDWKATPRGGPYNRYAGAEWLMVYWGGRYHGWVR